MPPRARFWFALPLLLIAVPALAQSPAGGAPRDQWNDQQAVRQATREEPVRLTAPSTEKSLPLPAPGKGAAHAGQGSGPFGSLVTLVGSLSVVLGLFFLASWCVKRSLPKTTVKLPNEVLEILGQTRLGGRLQVHLVRCGNKLLLISATQAGADTLTEITDPLEVDRLAGICLQARATSATASFRKLMDSFAGPKGEEDGDA